MTQDKILDKLQKIKNMADGAKKIGNEAEAQAFAAMLQNLLLKHKLDMTDLDYAKEMQEEPIIEQVAPRTYVNGKMVYKDFPDVEVVNRRREWAEMLAAVLADFHSCRFLVYEGYSMIAFVGHRSNVQIVEYLFLTLLRAADRMSVTAAKNFRAAERKRHGGAGYTAKGYRESWLEGFVTRIAQRLREERDAFGKKEGQQCTALVRVNKEALAVAEHMKQKKTKTAKALNQSKHFNHAGYADGRIAANNVNLKGNAVNAGNSGPNKLLS